LQPGTAPRQTLLDVELLLMQGCGVSARRSRQRQLALEGGQSRFVDPDLLCQRVTLESMHPNCFTQRLTVCLSACGACGRRKT
jgi:hypothetical protein